MKPFVIKLSGRLLDDPWGPAQGIGRLALRKESLVVIHGAGPQISRALAKQKMPEQFHEGLRITPDEAMTEVLKICMEASRGWALALRRAGAEIEPVPGGRVFQGVPRGAAWGRTGQVTRIPADRLRQLWDPIALRATPLLNSIAQEEGTFNAFLNINADEAAAALAAHMEARALVLLTHAPGVAGFPETLGRREAEKAILDGRIHGGMIPKVQACIQALQQGVSRAEIRDGRDPKAKDSPFEAPGTRIVLEDA